MSTTIDNDASLSACDRELLAKVRDVIDGTNGPLLIGREGANVEMPEPLFHVLTQAVRMLESGQTVTIFSQNEELTTQAAANYLGMSRPHLIKLLESGVIPFHYVGTHRRVYLKVLSAYQRKRDAERQKTMDALNQKIIDAELYDSDYTGEE